MGYTCVDAVEREFGYGRTPAVSRPQTLAHNVAPAPSLPPLLRDDVFNPFAVLGVTVEADREAVHRAYIHLAKICGPSQYATAGLPSEVCNYLSAMARRINAAYEAAKAARQK